MYIAIFGPYTPNECRPGNFVTRILLALEKLPVEVTGNTLLLQWPWMLDEALLLAAQVGCKYVSLEEHFLLKNPGNLAVAALNVCSHAVFILPYDTVRDHEYGHNHPIIEWAVLAYGLERPLYSDESEILLARMHKRIELESLRA